MTREQIDGCWKDPHNRKWGVYYCSADPRVIVPRRFKWMGWTVNAARPSAIPVLLFMIAVLVVPLEVVRRHGAGALISSLTGAGSIVAVCLLSAYLSSSARWNH